MPQRLRPWRLPRASNAFQLGRLASENRQASELQRANVARHQARDDGARLLEATAPEPRLPDAMPIHVKLFASLREQAGWNARLVAPEVLPATPLSLWRQLQLPDGEPAGRARPLERNAAMQAGGSTPPRDAGDLPQGIRVAVNQAFAAADTPLADGDELAFLPPISGG